MVFSIFWKAVVLIDLECHWGGGGGLVVVCEWVFGVFLNEVEAEVCEQGGCVRMSVVFTRISRGLGVLVLLSHW